MQNKYDRYEIKYAQPSPPNDTTFTKHQCHVMDHIEKEDEECDTEQETDEPIAAAALDYLSTKKQLEYAYRNPCCNKD